MGRGQELGFAFPASDHPLPPHSTEEFPGRGGACAGRHLLRGFSPSSRPMLPFFPPEGLLSSGEKAFKRLAWTGLKGKIYYLSPRRHVWSRPCSPGHSKHQTSKTMDHYYAPKLSAKPPVVVVRRGDLILVCVGLPRPARTDQPPTPQLGGFYTPEARAGERIPTPTPPPALGHPPLHPQIHPGRMHPRGLDVSLRCAPLALLLP